MKNIKSISLISFLAAMLLLSCNKDPVQPPIKVLTSDNIITIDSVKNMYFAVNADIVVAQDYSVYGTVTADEVSGNLYKEIYIQDATAGIKLRLTSSGSFYEGERVRVALKGATITRYKNMLSIDNIDPDKQIIKQGTKESITPEVVSIDDIKIPVGEIYSPYQGKLIKLDNVEFLCSDIFNAWANAVTQYSGEATLIDANNKQVLVRTSGFSSFANDVLPKGNGSVIAVVSQYNSTVQLTIRTPQELTLTGTRINDCFKYIKNFNDGNIYSGGWTTQNVIGNINWTTNDQGSPDNSDYATITNFNFTNFTNTACESWLISKEFDLTNSGTDSLSFRSAYKYSGNPLEFYVTTNYTGDVTTTTWTNITSLPVWSGGNFVWAFSKNMPLSNYNSPTVRFAFKYTGSNNDGNTWEIDDFIIREY
jgi:hypothetical protein